jgi:hypothetical protein
MSFGLNDNTVKRIASIAFHRESRNATKNISGIYHRITEPEQQSEIAQAHTTDAMQHKFKSKDDENIFKKHLAVSAAMNRGTLIPSDESNVMDQSPVS